MKRVSYQFLAKMSVFLPTKVSKKGEKRKKKKRKMTNEPALFIFYMVRASNREALAHCLLMKNCLMNPISPIRPMSPIRHMRPMSLIRPINY